MVPGRIPQKDGEEIGRVINFPSTEQTSLAWPDRFFPCTTQYTEKSGLATRDYQQTSTGDRELAYKMRVQKLLGTINCDEYSWFATISYAQRVSLPDARIRL